ncbi:MAG: ABC transporter permease [Gemmatimonadales bacterium]
MGELSSDLRQAARGLRRDTRFTLPAILTLSIGIALEAAVFTVFHAVLLTPLPYPDADRLAVLWSEIPAAGLREGTSAYANVQDWKARSAAFEDLAVWDPITLAESGLATPERVSAARVSSNLFVVLGVPPQVGRSFTSGEADDGQALAVASHAFAEARFGDVGAALGRTVVLDGVSFELIGVMPPDFAYPGADTQLWLPRTFFTSDEEATRRGAGAWRVVGRLRAGVDFDAAGADLRAIAAELDEAHPENAGLTIRAVPLREQQTGTSRRAALRTLFGAVGLVLLIACANAAHLILIRSLDCSADRAIRTALGASRLRLVRVALLENLLLASLAGLLGGVMAVAGVELIAALAPPGSPVDGVHVGAVTLLYTAGVSVAIGTLIALVAGLAPAIGHSGPAIELAAGARAIRSGPHGRRSRRLRDTLIAAQLALALILVFGASLLVRSALASATVDPGFEPEGVLIGNLSVPSPSLRTAFYENAVESAAAVPGVVAVGLIEDLFIGGAPSSAVTVEGGSGETVDRIPLRIDAVAGDLFGAIGVPLVEGRLFSSADGADATPVAIVNETMARRFWPGASPVGRRFRTGGGAASWVEVVGVVGDMRRQGVELEPIAQVFRPYAQAPSRNMNLIVRSDAEPDALAAVLRQRLAALDATIPLYGLGTVTEGMSRYVAQRRTQTLLLGIFSSVALLMAAVGIYGLLHDSVSKRRREIGVRVAIGAKPSDVRRMVLGEGLKLAVPGIGVGLLSALWLSDALTTLLYEVSPTDPASVALTALTLIAATLLASYVPARSAARVDPATALRGD